MPVEISNNLKVKRQLSFHLKNTFHLFLYWAIAVAFYKFIRLYGITETVNHRSGLDTIRLDIIHILIGGVFVAILFGLVDWGLHKAGLSTKSFRQISVKRIANFIFVK